MAMSGIAMAVFGKYVLALFMDPTEIGNQAALNIGISLIPIAALFQIVDGLQVTSICSLRGAKDTKIPMIITGVSYWVFGMGSALLLGFGLGYETQGIFWGLAIGLSVAAILLSLRFFHLSTYHFRYA